MDEYNFQGYSTDIYTIDSANAFAVGWSGNLIQTTDGGGRWDSTNIVAANQSRLHSIAHPAKDIYVVSGDYGAIIRSTDNARSWQASASSTSEYLEAVAFSSSNIGIAAGTGGTILRTVDQGLTWKDVPNPLSASNASYRRLAAFPNGRYYATTDSAGLFTSIDGGQNWRALNYAPQTVGMEFYNDKIGVIMESGWSSLTLDRANDSARFAFTKDGFASAPIEFNLPIINNNRMSFHFLDSNSFLCFGSDGFVVKVDMSKNAVQSNVLADRTTPIHAYPNPSASHSTTISYNLDHSGLTSIELWNALGEKVQTLIRENAVPGAYTRQLNIDRRLHGAYFVRVIAGNETNTIPIIIY